jgi:hypothetical protein
MNKENESLKKTVGELQKVTTFTLRKDQNGYRPVYDLGNNRGICTYECTFCGVRKSDLATPDQNKAFFEEFYKEFSKIIDGPYHPLIYNQGNVTDSEEFSRDTLDFILDRFDKDPLVKFVSINSREREATLDLLEHLYKKNLSYPIHFILGVESFAPNTHKIIGKNTHGEFERFIEKLKSFNLKIDSKESQKEYVFGLDVNLLFLPELFLEKGESREGNFSKIKEGELNDLRTLMELKDPSVPVEVNLHPYYNVKHLPYNNIDLDDFMKLLPDLQKIMDQNQKENDPFPTHLFVGIEGDGYEYREQLKIQRNNLKPIVDYYNLHNSFPSDNQLTI